MKSRKRYSPTALKPIAVIIVFLITGILVESANGQSGTTFNQRDDTYRVLGLKRAKEAYETARNEYERKQELYAKGIITLVELEGSKNILADAEVNYQQSLLAVLFEKQYVTVTRAVKYHGDNGEIRVRLTIANASGGTAEFKKLLNIDDELFRSLQPDIINNVYISLLNDQETIISQPYETKINILRYGHPEEIDFRLLEDLDVITVFIVYSNGNQRSMKVFLQKDASVDMVAIRSEQFSQEIELGQSASFDLALELFSGANTTYSLEVVNLPREIGRYFKEADSGARLSQLKFTESSHTKRASLEVSLPGRPTEAVEMDKAIEFYVLVMPRENFRADSDYHSKKWSEAEIKSLQVGYVRLELLSRGIGRLLVRAPQLYHPLHENETAHFSMEIINEGTHRLDNIEIETELPFDWTKGISPKIIPSLGIGEEKRVEITFTPPSNAAVGKYDARVRVRAISNNQPVNAEDKTVTLEIMQSASVAGTVILVALIISLVGGIVFFGVRISKK